MPRYFFDASCNPDLRDDLGAELAGPGEAREYAIRYAGACLANEPMERLDGDFHVTVRTETELTIFTVTAFVTDAPAIKR